MLPTSFFYYCSRDCGICGYGSSFPQPDLLGVLADVYLLWSCDTLRFPGADFLAATQVLIYVGGILVLLLFGVMLTHRLYNLNLKTDTFQLIPGMLISFAVFVSLALVATQTRWHGVDTRTH